MSDYIDRGIMKWQPFDALAGYGDMIKEMLYIKHKKEKPVLFEDTLHELDQVLQIALAYHAMVRITYYQDGYVYYQTGHILKVDSLQNTLFLQPKWRISLLDILNIELIDNA